jgi:hypothetical protein
VGTAGAGGGDEPTGSRRVGCRPASAQAGIESVGAVAAVAGDSEREHLAGRSGGRGAAVDVGDAASVDREVQRPTDANVVERREPRIDQ